MGHDSVKDVTGSRHSIAGHIDLLATEKNHQHIGGVSVAEQSVSLLQPVPQKNVNGQLCRYSTHRRKKQTFPDDRAFSLILGMRHLSRNSGPDILV